MGFSRGAFVARALNFLLGKLGVLRKTGLKYFEVLYEKWKTFYQTRTDTDADTEWNAMQDKLEQKQLLLKNPCITACVAWDTVAALSKKELIFVDQTIPQNVRLAVHAFALNEQRTQYTPLLWHEDEGRIGAAGRLHQCWFPGSHSDVGSGSPRLPSTTSPRISRSGLSWTHLKRQSAGRVMDVANTAFIFRWRSSNRRQIRTLTGLHGYKEPQAGVTASHFCLATRHKKEYIGAFRSFWTRRLSVPVKL